MKRKFFIFTLIFIFSILMVSCDYIFNIHGDYVELGNDYVFCNRVIGKVYSRENGMVFFNDIVPQQVLNHSQDDNYIVVYQVPYPDGMQAAIDSVRMSQHEIDSIHTLYQKMMDIVDCYWIIRIKDNKVWGPMDYQTYRRMHDELKIEEELDKSYENKYAGEKPTNQENRGLSEKSVKIGVGS